MRKVLIPTKLDKAAADLLTAKGFEVVPAPGANILELAAQHPETPAPITQTFILLSYNFTSHLICCIDGETDETVFDSVWNFSLSCSVKRERVYFPAGTIELE